MERRTDEWKYIETGFNCKYWNNFTNSNLTCIPQIVHSNECSEECEHQDSL